MGIARGRKAGNKKSQLKNRELKIFGGRNEIPPQEDSSPMVRAFEILVHLPQDMFPEGRRDDPPQHRKPR